VSTTAGHFFAAEIDEEKDWARPMSVDSPMDSSSRISICWQLTGSTGRHVKCELHRTSDGLTLRLSEGESVVVRRAQMQNIVEAFKVAECWKKAHLAKLEIGPSATRLNKGFPDRRTILEQRAKYSLGGGDLRRPRAR